MSRAIRCLMRLYAKNGRRAAAVQLYRTLAGALRNELDARPEAETRLVFAEIARGGEDLASDLPADHKVPALPATVARSSDAPGELLRAAKRLAFRLIGALALAGGLIVAITLIATRQMAADPHTAISVAVLPFVNLSSDKEQEFFSDGMTEEITAALGKVPDLRVVARTSAFEFKGKNVNIKTIGEELGATHLIEGSVRKAGNRLRITAQLIKADDGTHVWAEDYDRELTDVFAIQEDIARAITASLHMTLSLKPGENLVNNRKVDPDSYDKFLRAKGLVASRIGSGTVPDMMRAATLFEEVVAKNPAYAPAWSGLSGAYFLWASGIVQNSGASRESPRTGVKALLDKVEFAARKAVKLDPESPDTYNVLGVSGWSRGKLVEADELFQKAILLEPVSGSESRRLRNSSRVSRPD